MSNPEIVASVLGADYAMLGEEVADLERAGVDRIQWDIMDGRFVPNLSFGADVVAACRPHATVPYEAHLMVEEPDQWLQPFAAAGCDTIVVMPRPADTCTAPCRASGNWGCDQALR
jgi:ribulose-phosphate 3-epimerase